MDGDGAALFQQIPREEFLQGFVQYLEQHHLRDVEALVQAQDMSRHHAVDVSAQDLIDTNAQLGTLLLSHCNELLPVFDEALVAAQRRVLEAQSQSVHGVVKPLVHVRVAYLPPVPENVRENVSSIRASDTNRFIQVPGTVIRTAMIKVLEQKRVYECGNPRCKHQFEVSADVQQGYILEMPRSCPSNDQENRQRRCKSSTFHELEDRRVCCDCQEIRIQEQVQKLSVGMIPRTVTVLLENDLVDGCKAGDDVVVTGVVMQRWIRTIREKRCDVELVIRANHIRHNNAVTSSALPGEDLEQEFREFWARHAANPLRGRNILVGSICPQVKLAVAVTLAGGVGHVDDRGVKLRGEPHLLLVGDPGTGKSQFLRFACKLCPRSVMTTGVGTTSAGLTCTAVKEGPEWMLEAGALVLADGGLCAIDEFGSIRPHDRATIHEAMEQQTLSVAKAGLVTTLNTRTTVLAATNPKGTYDPTVDLSVNTAIASPLLSRFDMVLVLLDSSDRDWDETVSSFILRNAVDAQFAPEGGSGSGEGLGGALWPVDKMRAYLLWVKEHVRPVLSTPAQRVLTKYYQLQRAADVRSAARTTIRLLESLVRLAQAHARLVCRTEVTLQDAVIAVTIVETSMHTSSMLGVDSVLHTDFPDDPDEEYKAQEQVVLEKLGLRATLEQDAEAAAARASQASAQSGVARTFLASLHTNAQGGTAGNGPGPARSQRATSFQHSRPGSGDVGAAPVGRGGAGAVTTAHPGGTVRPSPSGSQPQALSQRSGGGGSRCTPPAPAHSQASSYRAGQARHPAPATPVDRSPRGRKRPRSGTRPSGSPGSQVSGEGVSELPGSTTTPSPAPRPATEPSRGGGMRPAQPHGEPAAPLARSQRPQDSQHVQHADDVEALLHSLEGAGAEAVSAPPQAPAGSGGRDEPALSEVNALLGPLLGEAAGAQPAPVTTSAAASSAAPAVSASAAAPPAAATAAQDRGQVGRATVTRHEGGSASAVAGDDAGSQAPQSEQDPLVDDAAFLALLSSDDGQGKPAAQAAVAPPPARPAFEGAAIQRGGASNAGQQPPDGGGNGSDAGEEDLVSQALSGLLEGQDAPFDVSGFEFEEGF